VKSKTWGVLTLVATAVAFAVASYAWRAPARAHAWPVVMGGLALAFASVGMAMQGDPRGILIDDRNMLSLSRLQITLWTLVIVSAYMTSAMSNAISALGKVPAGQVPGADASIAIPPSVWLLLGISVTSWVGAPMILTPKRGQPASPDQVAATLGAKNAPPPAAVPAAAATASPVPFAVEGVVLTKTDSRFASFSDLFRGEEVGNATTIDVGKLQLFFFTLTVVVAYAIALYAKLVAPGPVTSFPDLDASVVALMGISNAGYLANKAAPHSKPIA
jgi:hypothetical protein